MVIYFIVGFILAMTLAVSDTISNAEFTTYSLKSQILIVILTAVFWPVALVCLLYDWWVKL